MITIQNRISLSVIVFAFLVSPAVAGKLPDLSKTPGDAIADLTPAVVCLPGYATAERKVTDASKKLVLSAYGRKVCGGKTCVFDHLYPLELGGTNATSNLWPQSYSGTWNSRMKDAVEDRLHAMVCHGSLTLETARSMIRSDWTKAYLKLFPQGLKFIPRNDDN